MEIDVLLQPLAGQGFRASAGEPFVASAEGATRQEALENLRSVLAERVRQGAEVVKLRVPFLRQLPTTAIWPDDDVTRAWLEGIGEYRQHCDKQPDAWETAPGEPS